MHRRLKAVTDMAFDAVYSPGMAMWPQGTAKPHSTRNGEPDTCGGYALNHRHGFTYHLNVNDTAIVTTNASTLIIKLLQPAGILQAH